MSCGPYAVLWGRRCVLTEWILRIPHALGASPHGGRRVVGRTPCSQGTYSLNGQSLGHLLIVDAVLCDGRCVLKGSIFLIDTPWGISSWRSLCCGTDAVFSREVLFLIDILRGISSWRSLCCGTDAVFSNGVFFE
jgi:hypothetical protein